MKIKKLIKFLNKVLEKEGNVEVMFHSFCGTNNTLICFDFDDFSDVSSSMNVYNQLCLGGTVSERSREYIVEDIKRMEDNGYTYYRSQYVCPGELPKEGLSPCDWHNLW